MQGGYFDIMALSQFFIVVLMLTIRMLETSSDFCDMSFGSRGPGVAALINRTYPSCDQRNFSIELPICQIDSENTIDTCYAPPGRLPSLPVCPDDTWNRTCYPRTSVNMIHIACVCHSSV